MPIGGFDGAGWDETVPADTESAGLGDDRIRSLKTSLRQVLDSEHNFPSAGGDDVGYHRFGSARPYYGDQSAVSSSGSDGRLMLTSNSSRLFGVGSGGTVLLGGWNVLSADTTTGITWPQRAYWALEFGYAAKIGVASQVVTFPNSGFSGAPFVTLSSMTDPIDNVQADHHAQVLAVTATTFRWQMYTGSLTTGGSINWMSIGSRTL